MTGSIITIALAANLKDKTKPENAEVAEETEVFRGLVAEYNSNFFRHTKMADHRAPPPLKTSVSSATSAFSGFVF